MQPGIMHPPKNQLDPGKPRQTAPDQICVVHPALDYVWPIGGEDAPKRPEPAEIQPSLGHRETRQRHSRISKQRSVFPFVRKRDHGMRMGAFGDAEAKQSRLGAAIIKSGDNMQDLNPIAPSP